MARNSSSRRFDVRFVPDFIKKRTSGKLPPIVEVRSTFPTQEDGSKALRTYLFFGGVPSPKLHEYLTKQGFTLRRVKGSYYDKKKGVTVEITDNDNNCWAVYYVQGDTLESEHVEAITKIYKVLGQAQATGKTFLCPDWRSVDNVWGDMSKWLEHVEYREQESEAEELTRVTSEAAVDESDIIGDDVFEVSL